MLSQSIHNFFSNAAYGQTDNKQTNPTEKSNNHLCQGGKNIQQLWWFKCSQFVLKGHYIMCSTWNRLSAAGQLARSCCSPPHQTQDFFFGEGTVTSGICMICASLCGETSVLMYAWHWRHCWIEINQIHLQLLHVFERIVSTYQESVHLVSYPGYVYAQSHELHPQ